MSYKNSFKNQNWLLPVSIKSMIPENHICFFVEEFVESLNFSDFDLRFDGARIEINIVSIVHNLKKIWKYRRRKEEIVSGKRGFAIYFVGINLIVGQRRLLNSPEYLQRLIFSATMPKGNFRVLHLRTYIKYRPKGVNN